MIITISGRPGSGKSVVAKTLAKKLKLTHYSTGDFMRSLAKKRHMTLIALSEEAKRDNGKIDRQLDAYQKKLGRTKKDFIIDARLGFHFIPQSVKIFLDVEPKVAAQRIVKQHRGGVEKITTLAQATQELAKRTQLERQRYKKYYGIDYMDKRQYDLLVDTTAMPAAVVAKKILLFLKKKQ